MQWVIKIDVRIENNKILVNNKEFYVKGINYSPFGVGVNWRQEYPKEDVVENDFKLIKELGANVIRTYDKVPEYVFDLAKKYNLGVIDGIWIEQNNIDFKSQKIIDHYINHVKEHVKRDIDHDALFMYSIGNEINPYDTKKLGHKFWESFFKKMYNSANSADPDTPKSYAHIPIGGNYFANSMDIISLNIYPWEFSDGHYKPGEKKSFQKFEKYIKDHISSEKPLLITEFGMHSKPPNDKSDAKSIEEGENIQVQEVKKQFNVLKNLDIAGMIVFEYSDEWWKDSWTKKTKHSDATEHDFTDPEEFFGLVDIHRNKKKSFEVVREYFKNLP